MIQSELHGICWKTLQKYSDVWCCQDKVLAETNCDFGSEDAGLVGRGPDMCNCVLLCSEGSVAKASWLSRLVSNSIIMLCFNLCPDILT